MMSSLSLAPWTLAISSSKNFGSFVFDPAIVSSRYFVGLKECQCRTGSVGETFTLKSEDQDKYKLPIGGTMMQCESLEHLIHCKGAFTTRGFGHRVFASSPAIHSQFVICELGTVSVML